MQIVSSHFVSISKIIWFMLLDQAWKFGISILESPRNLRTSIIEDFQEEEKASIPK